MIVALQNFNKEFDAIIDAQKNYCLVDLSLAHDIRKKIKELVLKPYKDFNSKWTFFFIWFWIYIFCRNPRENPDGEMDRALKYDAESVELIIDRLFDVTY